MHDDSMSNGYRTGYGKLSWHPQATEETYPPFKDGEMFIYTDWEIDARIVPDPDGGLVNVLRVSL